MAFTDELATGVVPSGSPELLHAFALTPARAAGWTLFAFGVLGALLEPPLLALAHGRRERVLRVGGLALMAGATLAAALAPSYALLLAALALYGPASGVGTNLSEAALVAQAPQRAEQVLARWALLGALGDLVAPAALAASVALGFGWRGALVAVGLLAALQAVEAARAPAGEGVEEEGGASLREAVRVALRTPALLGWSLAAVLCALMDEVIVAFGALFLAQRFGGDASLRALVLSAGVAGALLGALVLERVSAHVRPRTLLGVSGVGCGLAYGAWLWADTLPGSAVTLGAVGLFAAMHHPLLRARAFAVLPERPNVVLAVGALVSALELAVPLAVGAVADGVGVFAAMLVLFLQPLGVVLAALMSKQERKSE
ncbi:MULTISPECIES: MFS transporter [Myxococcaceae]|uniref:MFS transporter n=1 Tax=Myxococcaceae TaxID=31 RepID=UPI0018902423|nr:MFS transporter [Simulacricoccus sp. 17bor-14]